MKKSIISLAVVLNLTMMTVNHAHAFRCQNGNLVREGDTSFEVAARCGQPADSEFVGYLKKNGKTVSVYRYLYVPPSGQFMRIVEFHNGVVAEIILGRRVE